MNCPLGKCMIYETCKKSAVCSSIDRTENSRIVASHKQINEQKKQDSRQEFKGTYLGYNIENGKHWVYVNGRAISADSLSNALIPVNSIVPVIIQGDSAFITAMPSS